MFAISRPKTNSTPDDHLLIQHFLLTTFKLTMKKWRLLPVLIKENIVKNMCIRDIISFAKCSKKCQNVLTFVPIHLPFAAIADNPEAARKFRFKLLSILFSVADISILATSRKFSVKQLELIIQTNKKNNDLKVFIRKLTESQKLLKIKELHMALGRRHTELFLGFLSICDPFYIETIGIPELFSQKVCDEIVKTPQWKNCKEVSLNRYCRNGKLTMPNVNIDDFLHFENVELGVATLDTDDAVKFVQNFRNAPLHAKFVIECRERVQEENLIRQKIEAEWVGDWRRTRQWTSFIIHPTKPDHVFDFYCCSSSLRGGWSLLEEFKKKQVSIWG